MAVPKDSEVVTVTCQYCSRWRVRCSCVRKEWRTCYVSSSVSPGRGSASAGDDLAREIKGKILRGMLSVIEKKVQPEGQGRPSDKLYGVKEFAFWDKILEGIVLGT